MSGKFQQIIDAQKKNAKVFSSLEKYIYNHFGDKTLAQPHLNLKYYSSNFECFSAWTSGEMKAFTDFINKFRKATWQEIFNSGGSLGQKTGFGRTDIDVSKYPKDNPRHCEQGNKNVRATRGPKDKGSRFPLS